MFHCTFPQMEGILYFIFSFSHLRLIFACDFHLPFQSVLPKSAKCIKNVLFESENKKISEIYCAAAA